MPHTLRTPRFRRPSAPPTARPGRPARQPAWPPWPARLGSLAPLALLAAACAAPAAGDGTAPGRVAIGVAFDPRRPGMAPLVAGVEQAVAELNALPEAQARGVTFVVRRAPAEVVLSARVFERLRDDREVVGIVGDAESGRTLDGIPVLEDRDRDGARAVVAVSPTATSTTLAGQSPWVFRLSPADDAASRAVASEVAARGARRAAVVYRNDPYGRDWAASFAVAFEREGGRVVARDPYVAGLTEWPVYARALARERPDVVVFPAFAEDAGGFVRALLDAGIEAPVVGGDALAPLADSSAYLGLRFAVPFDPRQPTTSRGAAFAAAFRARHGSLPGVRAALGYEAARLIGEAALGADLRAGDRRRQVRDWLRALGRGRAPAEGVAGPVAFDTTNAVVGRAVRIATVGEPERPFTPAAPDAPAGAGTARVAAGSRP